jgi:hypothetical protein
MALTSTPNQVEAEDKAILGSKDPKYRAAEALAAKSRELLRATPEHCALEDRGLSLLWPS